jgi:Fur family ferric uptake transcriptional regulator
MVIQSAQESIREAGLRATAPRVAVLSALTAQHDHPRIEQIRERVIASGTKISAQATYDVCEALRTAGLARRLQVAGSPVRYEARAGDNHHHLICRSCGSAVDVDCATGKAPCLDPGHDHGYALDEAEVTFWGICPGCQQPGRPKPPKTAQNHPNQLKSTEKSTQETEESDV